VKAVIVPQHRIAGRCQRGYAVSVRLSALKCWSVMLLILARLFAGAPVHAMPHDQVSDPRQIAGAGSQVPCADHAFDDRSLHTEHSGEQDDGSSARSGEDTAHDCCRGDTCACPAHLPAFVMPSAPFDVTAIVHRCPIMLQLPALAHRLTALFRPPA
jgi:hypothetical protein